MSIYEDIKSLFIVKLYGGFYPLPQVFEDMLVIYKGEKTAALAMSYKLGSTSFILPPGIICETDIEGDWSDSAYVPVKDSATEKCKEVEDFIREKMDARSAGTISNS